jgi:acetylornithine deacetylase
VIDARALAADAAALVQVPSVTGDERGVLERLAALAEALGLRADLHEHDLAALRAHPGHPGEEAARTELYGLTVSAGGTGAGRLALCAHVDVVPEGTVAWRHGPWSGAVEDGWLYGRGSVDMKGAAAAALHALAELARGGGGPAEVVLVAVASEEDGGLGAFAALERDAAFDACLIPEPTGFDVVCAQAGAVTFEGVVPGVAAHAAHRLEGVSAIDRYLPVHQALANHERALNADVEHPLMRALELPYPVLVGRLEAGEWSSSVPDRLRFEGRAPVRVGEDVAAARAAVEAVVAEACPQARLSWPGGQFASGETDPAHPFAALVRGALSAELDREVAVAGVPWGADMRLWTARGIPTVMAGTPGIELAHAVDERVRVDDLVTLARAIVRIATAFTPRRAHGPVGGRPPAPRRTARWP